MHTAAERPPKVGLVPGGPVIPADDGVWVNSTTSASDIAPCGLLMICPCSLLPRAIASGEMFIREGASIPCTVLSTAGTTVNPGVFLGPEGERSRFSVITLSGRSGPLFSGGRLTVVRVAVERVLVRRA